MYALYSVFFALGIAGLAYAKLGRRVGYGNAQSVWVIVGVTFAITWFVFFSLTTWVLHLH